MKTITPFMLATQLDEVIQETIRLRVASYPEEASLDYLSVFDLALACVRHMQKLEPFEIKENEWGIN